MKKLIFFLLFLLPIFGLAQTNPDAIYMHGQEVEKVYIHGTEVYTKAAGYDPLIVSSAQISSLEHAYYADNNTEGNGVTFTAVTDLVGSMNGTTIGTMFITVDANSHKYWDFDNTDAAIILGTDFAPVPQTDEGCVCMAMSEDKPTQGTFFSKADSDDKQFQLFMQNTGYDLGVLVGNGTFDQAFDNVSLSATPSTICLDWDTTDWRLYVNGVSSGDFTIRGPDTALSEVMIGARRDTDQTGIASNYNGGVFAFYLFSASQSASFHTTFHNELTTQLTN